MHVPYLFSLSLLLALCALAAAQADEVDRYLRRQMELRHIPGLSVAVVRKGKLVKAKGYGLANLELRVPATSRSLYDLCSIAKGFVATAIMMLVEEGRLGLEDRITQHLSGLPEAWGEITIRHLLSHTSGIKDFFNDIPTNVRQDYTDEEFIKLVADQPLNFQPGERYSYSNTGYHLLGMVLRKITGKPYEEVLAERIFRPLGMSATHLNAIQEVLPNRVSGYTWRDGRWLNCDYWSPTTKDYAGGGFSSTVLDMAKWDLALVRERLLKRPTLEKMWTGALLKSGERAGYGFGWGVTERNGHRIVGHGGGRPGFSTDITHLPDDDLAVIVLTNLDSAGAGSLSLGVASLYLSALREAPIEDTDPHTTEALQGALRDLAAGKLDPELLTPEMRAFFLPDRAREAEALLRSLGPLKSVELLKQRQEGDLRVRRYRARFQKSGLIVETSQTPEGKVAGAYLSLE